MSDVLEQTNAGRPITWLLPANHIVPPREICPHNVNICRTQTAQTTGLPLLSVVVDWDRGRAEHNATKLIDIGDCAQNNGQAAIGQNDILIVSGPKESAVRLSRERASGVYWLTIDGFGATDPQAVWQAWLAGLTTLIIKLMFISNTNQWQLWGERELRVHRSSPALTQMALLRASFTLVDQISSEKGPQTGICAIDIHELPDRTHAQGFSSILLLLRVSISIVMKTLLNRLTRSNKRNDQWAIGVLDTRLTSQTTELPIQPRFQDVRWQQPTDRGFIADPFLYRVGGSIILFFEELRYSDWQGRLKAVSLDTIGRPNGKAVTILEQPFHLSFPYVFEDSAEPDLIFLLPEQVGSGHTVLYSSPKVSDIAELQYREDTKLLNNYPGIDPIIFKWQGYYYLFITNGAYGNYDNNLQLFISDSLRGPYSVHPRSPIRTGLRGSRMAGPIMSHGNMLYRPGQNCVPRYGAGIILYQIEHLSPSDYQESEVSAILPDPDSQYGLGCHTVSWCEGLVAIDGLREVVVPDHKIET